MQRAAETRAAGGALGSFNMATSALTAVVASTRRASLTSAAIAGLPPGLPLLPFCQRPTLSLGIVIIPSVTPPVWQVTHLHALEVRVGRLLCPASSGAYPWAGLNLRRDADRLARALDQPRGAAGVMHLIARILAQSSERSLMGVLEQPSRSRPRRVMASSSWISRISSLGIARRGADGIDKALDFSVSG